MSELTGYQIINTIHKEKDEYMQVYANIMAVLQKGKTSKSL